MGSPSSPSPYHPAPSSSSSSSSSKQAFTGTGFLAKRGKYNKDWKQRWCVCTQHKIFYYRSKDQVTPISFIPLERAAVKVCKDPLISTEAQHVFEVITTQRVYYLSAPSFRIMNNWLDAIFNAAVELRREADLFEQAEELIAMSSIERSKPVIDRHLRARGLGQVSSSGSELGNGTLPQPFKNLTLSPSSSSSSASAYATSSSNSAAHPSSSSSSSSNVTSLSSKDILQQHNNASQTRLRFLGSLQIKPKMSNNIPTSLSANNLSESPPLPSPSLPSSSSASQLFASSTSSTSQSLSLSSSSQSLSSSSSSWMSSSQGSETSSTIRKDRTEIETLRSPSLDSPSKARRMTFAGHSQSLGDLPPGGLNSDFYTTPLPSSVSSSSSSSSQSPSVTTTRLHASNSFTTSSSSSPANLLERRSRGTTIGNYRASGSSDSGDSTSPITSSSSASSISASTTSSSSTSSTGLLHLPHSYSASSLVSPTSSVIL